MGRRILTGLLLAAAIAAGAPATASADHQGTIHPGVMTFTGGGQCTANFVFTSGTDTYIGQAAHCAGTGAASDTNGCEAGSLPLGTPVEIGGATRPGTLAYSSWLAMQANGETDPDACDYNDFALVRIDPADVGRVDPTVPVFGGPAGVGGPSAPGDTVFSYGNSSLRLGISQLSPKQGVVVQTVGNGWSRTVYTVTPGVPGDSGSGFLDAQGGAIGTLSTLDILPLAASNGVSDLGRQLNYARANGFGGLSLTTGTDAFKPGVRRVDAGDLPPPPSPPPPGAAKPVFSEITLTPRRPRVRSARRAKLSFTLTAAARTTIRLDRILPGRRRGKRHVKVAARKRDAKAAANTIKLGKLAGQKKLRRGRYRITLIATDARKRALAFKIRR